MLATQITWIALACAPLATYGSLRLLGWRG